MGRIAHTFGRAVAVVLLAACSTSAAQSANVDVTGTWAFTVETSAGGGAPTITLKQEGAKLAGHYSGQLGEADLTGSVTGADITFQFTVVVQDMQLHCTYTGSIENKDSLKGKVDIAGLATGTFVAKRQS